MGHRGWPQVAPENTIVSYELALDAGATLLECDLHLSRDGEPVLIHDDTLDRTTGRSGKVSDFNFDALRKLDAGSWKSRRYTGERIPHLDEFLNLAKGRAGVLLEIKKGHAVLPAIVRSMATTAFPASQVMILAWCPETLEDAKRHCPDLRTMLVVADTPIAPPERDRLLGLAAARGIDELGVENVPGLDAAFFEAAHRRGLRVYVWTVNEGREMRRLAAAGADSIGTDRAALGRVVLDSR